jgi:hypothetical protein
MRFPHLAHRSAAAHKLHSATATTRYESDSGKGETFSRHTSLSLFSPEAVQTTGTAAVFLQFILSFGCQTGKADAGVFSLVLYLNKTLPFERPQEPAETARVERQLLPQAPQLGTVFSDFIDKPCFAERAAAVEKAVVECTHPLRDSAVEAAHLANLIDDHSLTLVR